MEKKIKTKFLLDRLIKRELGKNTKELFLESSKFCKTPEIQDTKEMEFVFEKFCCNSGLQALVSLISIISSVMWHELAYKDSNEIASFTLLWIITFNSLVLWYLLILDHYIKAEMIYQYKKIHTSFWLTDVYLILDLVARLIFVFLHPNPLFHNYKVNLYSVKFPDIDGSIHLNGLFAIICTFRILLVIRFMLLLTRYHSARTQRICEIYDFDTNLFFATKSVINEDPVKFSILVYLIILIMCAFSIRVVQINSGIDFGYLNSLWCVIITTTTVGYGDYFPSNHFGRFLILVAGFLGLYMISVILSGFSNFLILKDTIQKNLYKMLNGIESNKEIEEMSKEVTSQFLRLSVGLKNFKIDRKSERIKNYRNELLLNIFNLKGKKKIDNMGNPYSETNKLMERCEQIENSLLLLKNQVNDLHVASSKLEKFIETRQRKCLE